MYALLRKLFVCTLVAGFLAVLLGGSLAVAGSLGASATLDLLGTPGNYLENGTGFIVDFDPPSVTGNVPLGLDEVTASLSEHEDGRICLEFQIASYYAGLEVPGDVWDLLLAFSVESPAELVFYGAGLSSGSMSAEGKAKVKISEGILDGNGILGDLGDLSIFDTETTLRKSDSTIFSPTNNIVIEKDILNAIAPDAAIGTDFPDTHLTYFKQTYYTTLVPEPASLLLFLFAGLGLAVSSRMKRNA